MCQHENTLVGLPALGFDVGRQDFRIEVGRHAGSKATYEHNCFAVLNLLVSCFRANVPFYIYIILIDFVNLGVILR